MHAPGDPKADARRDKEPNIETVPVDTVERMAGLAETARKEETWAWDALSRFVEGCAALRLDPLISLDGSRPRLLEILDQMVRAAHEEGALRPDVGTGDVLGVAGLVIRGLPALPEGVSDELGERAVRLVLAGMRAHPAPTPPGTAMTTEELIERFHG
ncbi:SbtR family transcriptional regulator [Nonomuraea sp. NPDC002799]